MRILHAFDLITPSGTAFLVNDLCNALTDKGQQVTWLASDYHMEESTIRRQSYEILMLRCSLNVGNLYYMPLLETWAKNHLKNYTVVHLHTARSYQNIILAKYARKFGIPYIIDSHGSLPKWGIGFKPALKTLYDMAYKKDILQANAVLAENQLGFLEYVNFGVSKDKIKIIMPPLNMKAYDVLPEKGLFRKEYNIDKPIVMFLGRINKIKGLEFLVRGFNKLLNTTDAILVLVGNDDGYEAELRHYIDLIGIKDKVLFTGFRGGKDKLTALVDADVVVQVSEYEQGAYAPLEAVLCGTPIIVSDNSGAGVDVAYLQAGLVCHWHDGFDLSEKMRYALAKPQSLVDLTKKAAQTIRKELSLENQIEKYIKVYKDLT